MHLEIDPPRLNAGAARRRMALAAGLVAFAVAVSAAIFSVSPDGGLALFRPRAPHLSEVLSQTLRDRGLEVALALYRTLRSQGFPGVSERESDLNDLGYDFLQKGNSADAIRIFELNAESHPRSANALDSLAEAYAGAGRTDLAVASYRRAIGLNPNLKSSLIGVANLTGVPRPPYSTPLMIHIAAGAISVALGFVAMFLRKGTRYHRLVGISFSLSMVCMCTAALFVAINRSQALNIFAASLTLYLIATGWRAAARRRTDTDILDWALLVLALGIACAETVVGVEAAVSSAAAKDGLGPALYLVFGGVTFLCAAGDIQVLVRAGLQGARRIIRHLWRMSLALFLATSSLFFGQEQAFPDAVRASHVLGVLAVLPMIMAGFWLVRLVRKDGWARLTYLSKIRQQTM